MPANLLKARELFLHAVGKLPPEEWDNYVVEACGGDAELEQQLRHMLRIHREAGSFLERPAVVRATLRQVNPKSSSIPRDSHPVAVAQST